MQCMGLDEAAATLAIQPSTLRRWARDRKIESVRLGRRLVFRQEALDAFIAAGIRSPKITGVGDLQQVIDDHERQGLL